MLGWIKFVRYLNWVTVQKTIACVIKQRLTGLAAEMAFHAMLGLFPAIIAILTAISLFEESVESTFVSLAIHFVNIVPIQVWTLLLDFIENIKEAEGISWLSFSSIAAVWVISGVLSAAIYALDRIHQVTSENRRSYLQTKVVAISLTILTIALLIVACFLLWVGEFLIQVALQQNWSSLLLDVWQIFSVIMVVAIATGTAGVIYYFLTQSNRRNARKRTFTIVVMLVITAIMASQLVYVGFQAIGNAIQSNIESTISYLTIDLWRILGFPIALGIVAIAFSLVYRHGASERIKNTPIFPGAILAAIFWAIVSILFRLYVSHIGIYSKLYGAVGTAIILMLWLYLSSLVMLIGEQINVIIGEAMNRDSGSHQKYLQ